MNSPTEHLIVRPLYLRLTDTRKNKSRIEEHQCWDAERFIAASIERYTKANADAKAVETIVVSVATREEYDAQRFGGRAAS